MLKVRDFPYIKGKHSLRHYLQGLVSAAGNSGTSFTVVSVLSLWIASFSVPVLSGGVCTFSSICHLKKIISWCMVLNYDTYICTISFKKILSKDLAT